MTLYEIVIPLIALGIGGLGVVYARWLSQRLERELAAKRSPAE